MDSKVRLHIAGPVGAGQHAPLTGAQGHYLGGVMRLGPGDTLTVFDGASGAWRARIGAAGKRGGHVEVEAQVAPQRDPPDVWLLFAPIRKARTDFIVEKATELGASRILPVSTRFTNAERIRRDRLQAHAVEAAEQCGGTYVPEVADIVPLDRLLDAWPEGRALAFCDEALSADPAWAYGSPDGPGRRSGASTAEPSGRDRIAAGPVGAASDGRLPPAPAAILIGPEGGFAPEERARLRAMPQATAIGLGPRILRADTAAVAALTLWQAARGDWR